MNAQTSKTEEGISALYLSEYLFDINEGSGFLSSLSSEDQAAVRAVGARTRFERGQGVFYQGDLHGGIWIIETGRARSYYTAPSGREITLAYWSPGHFIGGPEVFGTGRHVWSADALEDSEMLFLSGAALKKLVLETPAVALAIIEGLVAKGKCYSALIQMLGTRTVSERLRQFLVILADTHGRNEGPKRVIDRTITYEQIATVVGATRQWVSQSFDKLRSEGVLEITRTQIIVNDLAVLQQSSEPR